MSATVPALCRDCSSDVGAGAVCCADCGSPRVLRHGELHTLAIAHVDCDAFYATVEKRDDPALRDRPIIVGGAKRGVVLAACYLARRSGVHSAMAMYQARRLCPEAVVVRPDMTKYAEAGRQVRDLMRALTPAVEPLSIDEAFLDLQGTERVHDGSPAQTLIALVRRIEDHVGVTVSVGLSHNKYVAKVASDLDKPRGFSIIGRGETLDVLGPLPVRRIWGVGSTLGRQLATGGIERIAQLQTLPEAALTERYGPIGGRLYRLSRGINHRHVRTLLGAKSVSCETTFARDIVDPQDLRRRLWLLCERLAERLKNQGLAARQLTLKLKTARFRVRTRSRQLPAPTQLADTLFHAMAPLLAREADGTAFRLIGVGTHQPTSEAEADLPDLVDDTVTRRRNVAAAIDAVRAKLGRDAITRGRAIDTAAEADPPTGSPDAHTPRRPPGPRSR